MHVIRTLYYKVAAEVSNNRRISSNDRVVVDYCKLLHTVHSSHILVCGYCMYTQFVPLFYIPSRPCNDH